MVSGWPKRYKPAHAFRWEYSYKRLKLAQLLGQLGALLTLAQAEAQAARARAADGAVPPWLVLILVRSDATLAIRGPGGRGQHLADLVLFSSISFKI